MRSVRCFLLILISVLATPSRAQQSQQPAVQRDPQAVALLQRSVGAMTNGVAVADATLSGSATRTAGSDHESGGVVLQAKGTQESKVALTLSNSTYTEVRSFQDGVPEGSYAGPDGVVYPLAQHNCFTGAGWFLPPLSALASAVGGPNANISYIGQETWNGIAVQHVKVWLSVSSPDSAAIQAIAHLSTTEIYLDSITDLPVAMTFTTHPTDNSSVDMAVEIRFSNYQQVSGILLPLHIQKFFNGGLNLDLTISSVTINSGLPDSNFTM